MSYKKIKDLVKNKFGGKCAYCGNGPNIKLQADHIIPKANFITTVRAGHYNLPEFLKHLTIYDLDHIDNLMPACSRCNLYKHSLSLEEFRQQISYQVERARKTSYNFSLAEDFGQIRVTNNDIVFYFEKHPCGAAERQ